MELLIIGAMLLALAELASSGGLSANVGGGVGGAAKGVGSAARQRSRTARTSNRAARRSRRQQTPAGRFVNAFGDEMAAYGKAAKEGAREGRQKALGKRQARIEKRGGQTPLQKAVKPFRRDRPHGGPGSKSVDTKKEPKPEPGGMHRTGDESRIGGGKPADEKPEQKTPPPDEGTPPPGQPVTPTVPAQLVPPSTPNQPEGTTPVSDLNTAPECIAALEQLIQRGDGISDDLQALARDASNFADGVGDFAVGGEADAAAAVGQAARALIDALEQLGNQKTAYEREYSAAIEAADGTRSKVLAPVRAA